MLLPRFRSIACWWRPMLPGSLPMPYRGKRNEPAWVRKRPQTLGRTCMSVSPDEIAAATTEKLQPIV